MLPLLALLPTAIVVAAILVLRLSGLTAAALAAASATALWLASVFAPLDVTAAGRALADAAVLTALAAAMIVPGLLFVEATRGRKSPEAMATLVETAGLPPARAAILIAAGIGITVESLTGMGVSLLVTMPLLLARFSKPAAVGIGLVGMSLMPWGALAISAHVGAGLAQMPVPVLARYALLVSGPVAFFLPLLCLLFVPDWRASDVLVAVLAGLVLVAGIAVGTRIVGVEVAGVVGGLAVIGLMLATAPSTKGLAAAITSPGLAPYAVLVAVVVAQKLAIRPLAEAGISPALATERVRFLLLTSPGFALLTTTLLLEGRRMRLPLLAGVAARAWRPLSAIALFLFAAMLLSASGAMEAFASAFQATDPRLAVLVVAGLGAVGGFATGSGVTSNALFMANAVSIAHASFGPMKAPPEALTHVKIFAALQNGAAGHVAMASLPVAAILLATLTRREAGDEARIMRTALALAVWHLLVATTVALVVLGFRWPWQVIR